MGTDFVTRGVLVMLNPTLERVVGVTDLEQEIEAEFRNRPPVREQRPVNFAPPRVRAPALSMPDYVEHREGATEIGKLSAEAVVREYDAAGATCARHSVLRVRRPASMCDEPGAHAATGSVRRIVVSNHDAPEFSCYLAQRTIIAGGLSLGGIIPS